MIVLDTHVFLWYALGESRLDRSIETRLNRAPDEVHVPSICMWEAMMLHEKKRISIQSADPADELSRLLEESGFRECPLTNEIALLSRTLQFDHSDPADRFIAATAFALRAELATSDVNLRRLPWVRLAY